MALIIIHNQHNLCHLWAWLVHPQTFASWGVDMLKLDGCNIDSALMPTVYPAMTAALNATGRPIVFSCSWPAYISDVRGREGRGQEGKGGSYLQP